MDKKKLYITIIAVCFLATAGIIYWGTKSPGIPETGLTPTSGVAPGSTGTAGTKNTAAKTPIFEERATYQPPRVFPSDTELDLSVFESDDFRKLNDYTPLTVGPEEIGRDNPFSQP